jgi:hypothetical protein
MSETEPGSEPAPSLVSDEEYEELEYWLSNEDWYKSRFTQNWLKRTPPEVAVEVLAPLAAQADLEPRNPWAMFVRGFVASGFSATSAIAGQKIRIRRAGVRAALMLAELNDARAIPALVRVFEPNRNWQHKYQELIEDALVQFLSSEENIVRAAPYADHLRNLARRIWESGNDRHDLSPRFATVLLAILPALAQTEGEENAALLKEIASHPVQAAQRRRVQEAVGGLLLSTRV